MPKFFKAGFASPEYAFLTQVYPRTSHLWHVSDLVLRFPYIIVPEEPPTDVWYKILSMSDREDAVVYLGRTRIMNTPVLLLPSSWINPHMLILGLTGGGKSTTLYHIVMQLHEQGVNVVVFDRVGEYVPIARMVGGSVIRVGEDAINVMELPTPDTPPTTWIDVLINSILQKPLKLSPQQTPHQISLLTTLMYKAYVSKGISFEDPSTWTRPAPTLATVYDRLLEEMEGKKGEELRRYQQLENKLKKFVMPPGDAIARPSSISLDMLTKSGLVVIDASAIQGTEAMDVLMLAIPFIIYFKMIREGRSPKLKVVYVVDEAHAILSLKTSVLERILREGRKHGVSLVLATQTTKEVEDIWMSQPGMIFVMRMTGEKDLNRLKASDIIPPKFESDVPRLDRGEGFLKLRLKHSIWNDPIRVKVDAIVTRMKQLEVPLVFSVGKEIEGLRSRKIMIRREAYYEEIRRR